MNPSLPVSARRLLSSMGEADDPQAATPDPREAAREWTLMRPSLPPLLFLALSMWASLAVALDAAYGCEGDALIPFAVCGIVLLAAGIASAGRRAAILSCLLMGAGLGCLLAASQAQALISQQERLVEMGGRQAVEAVHDSRRGEFGSSVIVRTAGGSLARVYLDGDEEILVGQAMTMEADWKPPGEASARSCWRDGVVAVSRARHIELGEGAGPVGFLRDIRRRAITDIREMAGRMVDIGIPCGDAGLLLCAVLLGYTDGLHGSPLYQSVKVDGLAHLVAVSGAHLVVVCGLILALMRRLPFSRAVAVPLQVLVIAGYLVLTGAPVSAIRAAVMSSLALFSFFSHRRPYALGALSACTAAMLAIDPAAAFSASFLLSAGSTLGIVLFSGFFAGWIRVPLALPEGAVLDSLALTLASSVVTTPLSASLFGQVSLIAPAANALSAPLFAGICVGGMCSLFLFMAVPLFGQAPMVAMMAASQLFCWMLEAVSGVPGACAPASLDMGWAVFSALAGSAFLWVVWPRPRMGALACTALAVAMAVVLSAHLPYLAADELVMLDVGQGDAILLRSRGHAVLVDTGTQDAALLEGLAAHGVRSLDAVLISHPDDDHCGSLQALRGVVGVRSVLVARDLPYEDEPKCAGLMARARALVGEEGIVGLSVGDVVSCGNLEMRVIGPDAFSDGGGNADSLTVVVEADDDADGNVDHTALLCGDAESAQLRDYLRKGRLRDVEVYKVGHHGSRAAVDAELAGAIHPRVSLVSVGAHNRYGHPVPETLAALRAVGSSVFRTDEDGDIVCRLEAERLVVVPERRGGIMAAGGG